MNFDVFGVNQLIYKCYSEHLSGDSIRDAINIDLLLSRKDENFIDVNNTPDLLHDQDNMYLMMEQNGELNFPS